MGLDMYLSGEKFLWTDSKNPENNPIEDGYRVKSRELELGYWWKHPDLHGYIVNNFANGVDDCQRILLELDDLNQIVSAIENGRLPKTTGFFFGESVPESKDDDIAIFTKAIEWAGNEDRKIARTVYYRASW